jgi:hypothetical protein
VGSRSPSSSSITAFSTPDIALLTEQDMLGDRLVRRRKRKKSTEAFLNELAALSPAISSSCRSRHRAAMRG